MHASFLVGIGRNRGIVDHSLPLPLRLRRELCVRIVHALNWKYGEYANDLVRRASRVRVVE